MKKSSLSAQITFVFLASFIITSIILGIFITRRLDSIYENNVYERLEAEGKALKETQDISKFERANNISFIRYWSAENIYNTSDNINEFLEEDSVELLINKASAQNEISARYVNAINDKIIYYVILNYQGFFGIRSDDIFIILTDSSMKTGMVSDTALQIFIACLVAFALGYLVVLLWTTKLVRDTKRISNSLEIIGVNHYKTKVSTNRHDEMGELVNNIEAMRNKIIQHERNKQEIIQGVSHDLKTPIAIIHSYAEALEDGISNQAEATKIIKKECNRLNNKVTKLLDLTRLGYIDVNDKKLGKTNMDDMIRELVVLYSYQTKVDIKLDLSSVEFFGDRESWFIAIQNIMDNAIRYAKSKIIISVKENELIIYNDGKKIKEKHLSSIFDAFEKGDDGNSGLGLSIVKKTVELFGYEVKADNYNKGVQFIISYKD
jgi:two-component system, OmpR family, sensor histidine kinase CssS